MPLYSAGATIGARVSDLPARDLEEKFWLFMIPGDLDNPAKTTLARHLRLADPRTDGRPIQKYASRGPGRRLTFLSKRPSLGRSP